MLKTILFIESISILIFSIKIIEYYSFKVTKLKSKEKFSYIDLLFSQSMILGKDALPVFFNNDQSFDSINPEINPLIKRRNIIVIIFWFNLIQVAFAIYLNRDWAH